MTKAALKLNMRFAIFLFFVTAHFLCLSSAAERPNVLIAISDDQSYPHASAYGEPVIHTPGFDEVARRGVLFHNAFTPAPGCSPMRAAFLTGKYIWQIGAAGTHASHFPKQLETFPGRLAVGGYHVGYTGKAWGPGNFKVSGRAQNPAGPSYNSRRLKAPQGISARDYAANFADFLDAKDEDAPFCFWYGGHEPHRVFKKGIGAEDGKDPNAVRVPDFLPDSPECRNDMLDYFYEIEWFDNHLARMLAELKQRGLLQNTLVIVTSDNGMSFPRAKANVYEYGIHMPLAISWPAQIDSGQKTNAIVNLIDVTATIYDACEVRPTEDVSGRSLIGLMKNDREEQDEKKWTSTFSGRERHSSSRFNSLGYPQRCVRTKDYLYIRNYAPERWPAGAPQKFSSVRFGGDNRVLTSALGPEHGGYHDIDACPTLNFMIGNRDHESYGRLFDLAVQKRPAEELYAIQSDASCLKNLVDSETLKPVLERLRAQLTAELRRTDDLRETDFEASHVWETYPRYSSLRWFPEPDWAKKAEQTVPRQDWLDVRRPR